MTQYLKKLILNKSKWQIIGLFVYFLILSIAFWGYYKSGTLGDTKAGMYGDPVLAMQVEDQFFPFLFYSHILPFLVLISYLKMNIFFRIIVSIILSVALFVVNFFVAMNFIGAGIKATF